MSPLSLGTFQRDPSANDQRTKAAKFAMTASSALVEFESQELCPNNKGEEIIAMEKDPDSSGELVFGCDKCVFERRLKDPVFLAYQAR